MKNFKTLYIVLIFVVTAIIIAASIGFRFGFKRVGNFLNSPVSELVNVDVHSSSIPTESFSEIDIKADVCSFEIVRGEDYHVDYTYPINFNPKVEVSNGTLEIEAKADTPGININGNGFRSKDYKIIVYIPEGAALSEIKTDADFAEIGLSDIKVEKLHIEADAGSISLTDIESGDTEIKTDAGDIKVRNSTLGDTDIESDAGSVELESCKAQSIKVSADLGNTELDNTTFIDGVFSSSMGNIKIDGTFDSVDADCSLGAVSIDADNPDAKINVEVELGSIEIDGKNIKGRSYHQ